MDESIPKSANDNNTRPFTGRGLIVPMQKMNQGVAARAAHNMLNCGMALSASTKSRHATIDEERMREIYEFTARTMKTARPVPFGALIVHTSTGKRLMRATNAVLRESDPSAHGETRTVRLACKKLRRPSLAGFTMYSTCEPCAMCMANALWARLDRVVFGATIEDANRYVLQIHIPAKEVASRSDLSCLVEGPVLRDLCNMLFTHPNMQKAFRTWGSSKIKSVKS
jgi:tRNA(Arg) A34 adenosine deaminase TadA